MVMDFGAVQRASEGEGNYFLATAPRFSLFM